MQNVNSYNQNSQNFNYLAHIKQYIVIAAIIYLITSIFSVGHNHPDEYYQILQFAAYKIGFGLKEHLTWEYFHQMRSAFLPEIVIIIYKFFSLFNLANPFFITFITRLLAGIFSLFSILVFINTFIHTIKDNRYQKWFILLSLFTWLTVYNNIRFSPENLSAKFFLLGISFCYTNLSTRLTSKNILAGIMLGLAFTCRFQTGFLIFGLMLWLTFINKSSFKILLILGITILITILISNCLIDYHFYETFTITPWNYFTQNILLGQASNFGNDPWYFYLYTIGFLPFGPMYIGSLVILVIYRPKNIFIWTIIPFIFSHELVGHKEFRFLVPLLNFMPLLIMYAFEILKEKKNFAIELKLPKTIKFAWYMNCFLIIPVALLPSAIQISLCKAMYNKYTEPTTFYYITEGGNELDFYKRVNMQTIPITTLKQIQCSKNMNCLVALTCQQSEELLPKYSNPVYSLCPSWIKKLDFNNWLERTAIYNVYELNNIESINNK